MTREQERRPRRSPSPKAVNGQKGEGGPTTGKGTTTPIEVYARNVGMSTEQLRSRKVTEIPHHPMSKGPVLRLLYLDERGAEMGARFVDLKTGADAWRKEEGPRSVFGLHQLTVGRNDDPLLIVRNEHEAIVCQHDGQRAITVHKWTPDVTQRVGSITAPVGVLVGDTSPETLALWTSRLPDTDVRLVLLPELRLPWSVKGLRASQFIRELPGAVEAATSLKGMAANAARERRDALWASCHEIAEHPRILDAFAEALEESGVTGVALPGKLIYLQMTSRLQDKPVSIAVRAVSSAGKSFLVQGTLAFFPASAYLSMTAMSDRALMYLQEPLAHRVLVLTEAEGMGSDIVKSALRSLLSEGRLRYTTVVAVDGETPQSRTIEIAGPTGLLVTHTKTALDPELETRLIGLTVPDTSEQTAAVMEALAIQAEGGILTGDRGALQPWRDFQEWLALGDTRAVVPYARDLRRLIPPKAVRMRRDFGKLLTLIAAHALLHQVSRERNAEGNIVATIGDYTAVRKVFGRALAQTMESAVPPEVREVVDAVNARQRPGHQAYEDVSIPELRRAIRLADAPLRRRVALALDLGYLTDRRRNRHAAHELVPGEPMPTDAQVLPTTRELRAEIERSGDGSSAG